MDAENRAVKQEAERLRHERNRISKQIGGMIAQGKRGSRRAKEKLLQIPASCGIGRKRKGVEEKIKSVLMNIPNIIDDSVPIGRDERVMLNWNVLESRSAGF